MGSKIKISVSGLNGVVGALNSEPQNQLDAMVKAQAKLATQAVSYLKRGLSHNGGRGRGQVTSPKGEMPYLHTGRLRNSIGYRTKTKKANAETQVGSGAMGNPIEYAKYLQGKNGDGLRPFLWAVKDLVTPERLITYFNEYYKPLQGGK